MTAYDYSDDAAFAQEIIDEFGREVSLVKFSRTPANAAAPWEGNVDTSTTNAVTAAILDPKSVSGLGLSVSYVESLVREAYMIALVAASELGAAVSGETYDQLVDGTDVWGIVNVDKLQPGDTPLLYYFVLEALR